MVPISAYYLDQDPPNASTIRESISRASPQQPPPSTEPQPSTEASSNSVDASIVRGGPAVMEPVDVEKLNGEIEAEAPPPASKDEEGDEDLPPRPISRDEPQESLANGETLPGYGAEGTQNEGGQKEEQMGEAEEERNTKETSEGESGLKTEGIMDDVNLGNDGEAENEESPADQEIDLS